MPKGQGTELTMGRQIVEEPFVLSSTLAATHRATVAIENNDVPSAQVQTVVALRRLAGCRTPIVEVSKRLQSKVLVVAENRDRASLELPPSGTLRLDYVAVCPVTECPAAHGKHRAGRGRGEQPS